MDVFTDVHADVVLVQLGHVTTTRMMTHMRVPVKMAARWKFGFSQIFLEFLSQVLLKYGMSVLYKGF